MIDIQDEIKSSHSLLILSRHNFCKSQLNILLISIIDSVIILECFYDHERVLEGCCYFENQASGLPLLPSTATTAISNVIIKKRPHDRSCFVSTVNRVTIFFRLKVRPSRPENSN